MVQNAAVHRRLDAARVGVISGKAQIIEVIHPHFGSVEHPLDGIPDEW
jgi:hypothetical protein